MLQASSSFQTKNNVATKMDVCNFYNF